MASWFDSLLPASNVSVPQPYQLTHNAGADTGAYAGAQALNQYNLGGQNLGQYQNLTQQGVANPYGGQYQQGAGVVGGMGVGAGQQAFNAGGQIMGAAQGALPDVQALLQMGFDPQGALYARTQQQMQDQNAARAAQQGVAGTPYGQGVQNQANSNFNIDWQNQQLQRALAGAQGAGGLLGQLGASSQQGAGMQNAGLQEMLQGFGQPYNTFRGINADQLALLNQAGGYGQQAAQIPQQQIQDYLAYLNQSNQNQNTQISAQQLNLAKQKAIFDQAQALGKDAGQAIGAVAGMPMGGGGGNPFAAQFGSPTAYAGYNQTGLPGNSTGA
jgi:hypothetical protein